MKTVKQLLEKHDKTKVSVSVMEQNIMNLVRSGLLEEGKTHILRRSLIKDPAMLTVAEKRVVLDVLGEIITEKDHLTKADKTQDNTSNELPAVIILKRKAIRVYPDKQKIGLYYSQALDKYISIPYGPSNKNISAQITEETDPQVLEEATQETIPEKQYATIDESFDAKVSRLRSERVIEEGEYMDTATTFGRNALNGASWGATGYLAPRVKAGARTLMDRIKGKKDSNYEDNLADEEEKTKAADEANPIAAKAGELAGTVGSVLTGAGVLAGGAKIAGKVASKVLGKKAAVETAKSVIAGKVAGKAGAKTRPLALKKRATPLSKTKAAATGAAAGAAASGADKAVTDRAKAVSDTASDAAALFQRTNDQHDRQYNFNQIKAPISAPPLGVLKGQDRVNSQLGFGVNPYVKPRMQESNLSILKNMVENNISTCTITFGDNSISINNRMAKKLVKVYESLNRKNKKNMEKMLNESATSFTNVINFSVRQ